MMNNTVIIGNGISGISAALKLRERSDCGITVISRETSHLYSRPALMYIFMGDLKYEHTKIYEDDFWKEKNIHLIKDTVTEIDIASKSLRLKSGNAEIYDKLLLATGSLPRSLGIPGDDLPGVQGFYSYDDLRLLERNIYCVKHAVITGGGLIGVELAEMLLSRGIRVTFLVRDRYYWGSVLPDEEAALVGDHIKGHAVDLRLSSEVKEIISSDKGRIAKVRTSNDETIDCQFLGITIGVRPNISFIEGSGIECDSGILVNQRLETSVPDIYASGDCAQFREPYPGRKPVEQVWYTARIQGEAAAANILGDGRDYLPGVWFNSAKFFNIEYQTYGIIQNRLPEDEETFYWENPHRNKAVRINYKKNSGAVCGFNFLGIRARHAVCEKWIAEKTDIKDVIEYLREAHFDPEFTPRYEQLVIYDFLKQTGSMPKH